MEATLHHPTSADIRAYSRPGRPHSEKYYALSICDGYASTITVFGSWDQIHGMCDALAQAHKDSNVTLWRADE